ncbi:MAG: riboflavin biosynthesis protein RibD [Clostridia bacterium]|nr:riboflavin biosynthesis protein RibD [Clostridia bacterium]
MPKIIMHNHTSVDGAIAGFQINPAEYYTVVNSFSAQMYLVGSETARLGIKHFGKKHQPETLADYKPAKHIPNDSRPYWVIPDSEGRLLGQLHHLRQYEHCREVIVLITAETPAEYSQYLQERQYPYFVAGEVKVDFKNAFAQLDEKYTYQTMVTDNGGKLSAVLLDNALVDQISLVISPTLTDRKNPKLFGELKLGKRVIKLNPVKAEIMESKNIRMLFEVVK